MCLVILDQKDEAVQTRGRVWLLRWANFDLIFVILIMGGNDTLVLLVYLSNLLLTLDFFFFSPLSFVTWSSVWILMLQPVAQNVPRNI